MNPPSQSMKKFTEKKGGYKEHQREAPIERANSKRKRNEQSASGEAER